MRRFSAYANAARSELLPGREVVVDERSRHARLLRDGADAQVARATADDDAAGGAQDLVDAARRSRRVEPLAPFPASAVS